MLQDSHAFSGISVNSLDEAETFYGETLGLKTKRIPEGLELHCGGDHTVFVYEKPDHQPATYTALYFPVENIDQVVQELKVKGIAFEHYPEMTGEDNIARGRAEGNGPDIAWFKDPAGNFLAVVH